MPAIPSVSIRRIALLLIISFFIRHSQGQPAEQMIKVVVAPDHTDWTYKPGEKVKFTITVLKSGNVLRNAVVKYEVGPERMEPTKKDSLAVAAGTLNVDGGTMKSPGFLRCIATAYVNGKTYRGLATAAFNPLQIEPTIENPSDFNNYWDNAKAALAAIPIDAKMTLLPERCTENVNVYHVNLQNYKEGTRLYGILCVPKKE